MRELFYFPLTQPSPSGEGLEPVLSYFKALSLEGEGWVRGSHKRIISVLLISSFIKSSLLRQYA